MTTMVCILAALIAWAIATAVLLRAPRTTGILLIAAHIYGAWDYWAHGRPMCATLLVAAGIALGSIVIYVDAVTARRRRVTAT